jgi:GNAT superfamily N-acetyltransferase
MRAALLELAEEPGLWIPLAPPSEVIEADGYAVVTSLRSASVERVRLAPHEVERAVDEVRALAQARAYDYVTWWLGELTTPADCAERLLALGLAPAADQAEMTSLTLDRRPNGEPTVEVHRVETPDEYLRALELDWEVWGVPEEKRAGYRPIQRDAWPLLEATGRMSLYLAYLEGEPVGFGRLVFAPAAGILMGGSTLPAARGRGVYTSLVHARWQATVERGVPRLAVSAGPMSAPILARLGFEPIGKVLLLRDSFASRS